MYRIKKIQVDGETSYAIEKKLWGFWVDCRVLAIYYVHTDYNADPAYGCKLINRYYSFRDETRAKWMIEVKKRSLVKIKYKHQTIIEVYNEESSTTAFVNKSFSRWWNDGFCYEYAHSLEKLKTEIDKRKAVPIVNYTYIQ